MKFSELPAGRYSAHVYEWGIEEVEYNGSVLPKVKIKFLINHEGQSVFGFWDSFINTKDGMPNKHTVKTILTCGYQAENWNKFNEPDALDKALDLEVVIEKEDGYNRIKWVNDPASEVGIKKVEVTTLKSPKYAEAFREAKREMKIIRRSPPTKATENDDLPF